MNPSPISKSENIILAKICPSRLQDFGISCCESQVWRTGRGLTGTPLLWYCALGITALIPFHDMEPQNVAFAVAEKNARPPLPSLPDGVAILTACWEANPVRGHTSKRSLRYWRCTELG
ncbi:hypothetical protein HPP92_003428 [Vanilla planifolia]|uniref:Uncharacterized protein n=1 Tax=Vanilla planifolia TaxID=51239 RepID=A0A835SBT7_VANPL|nr:hypothetical protein HPP92_003428 [Vanilla planifolia]